MSTKKTTDDQYTHVTAESFERLKTPQERSVWAIKLLRNWFISYLLNTSVNPDKLIPSPKVFDLKTKFDNQTIFSEALRTGYYRVAYHYIKLNKQHPDFKIGLNLTDEQTIQALKNLVAPEKPPKNRYQTPQQRETANDKRLLRIALMDVFLPRTIAFQRGMRNETDFSAALKLGMEWGELRPAYRALKNLDGKSQDIILRELNLTDSQTKSLLYQITAPHTPHKHYQILTAKLQQLLTSENFVEQIRGKHLSYQDRQNLIDDERDNIIEITNITPIYPSSDKQPSLLSEQIKKYKDKTNE